MNAVIIYKYIGEEETEGGIYKNISLDDVINEITENQGAGADSLSRDEIIENQIILYLPLVVSGKTYAERKADLHNKAVKWSNTQGEYPAWSYGELADIQGFFERNGRRYGLLKEFQENAIC